MKLDPLQGLGAAAEESTESAADSKAHVWLENRSFGTPRENPAFPNGRGRQVPVNRSYGTLREDPALSNGRGRYEPVNRSYGAPREDPALSQTRRNTSRGRGQQSIMRLDKTAILNSSVLARKRNELRADRAAP